MNEMRTIIESEKDSLNIINHLKSQLNPVFFEKFEKSKEQSYCGRIFSKGDIVYSCKTCGIDNTCVLCADCFKSTNHDDHLVSYHFSLGAGGCCDCSDPEAWKQPLNCKIHDLGKSK
eukprot:NODE_116_length_18347_cov_2.280962.p16 type:complete len:117 gc:universal NODE_116_length_18347_cov_2.280962:1149-799(-)